jgi:hypothetical protein
LQSCGDDNEDEPTVNDIQGTWLLTHYSYKYHYLHNDTWWDDTKDEDVTSSYLWDNPMGSDSFSLTYKDTAFDKQGEYKLYVYTFKRNC